MKVKKDFRRLAARMDTVPGNIADMFGFSPASTEMLLRKRGQLRDGEGGLQVICYDKKGEDMGIRVLPIYKPLEIQSEAEDGE